MASQSRLDQIRDLVNQWEQIVGYRATVADWMVSEMADNPATTTIYDLGQYMAQHVNTPPGTSIMDGPTWYQMPWAPWGMSMTQYSQKLEAYDSAFRTLTGQSAPQDLIDAALKQHQGMMTGQQFETWLLAQESIKNTYGWLKFGLDFQQFQTQKLQMRTGFGRDLTDAEAVAQLQYHHAAQGGNVGVAAQQTLGQAEKKQAQTGISGSVVR